MEKNYENLPRYGSNITTTREANSKKTNLICPDHTCGYNSRGWIMENRFSETQKNSVGSKHCPIHNKELINVGTVVNIPKAGTKKRKELIKRFS